MEEKKLSINQTIKKICLIYDIHSASEKEAIKEFLRFIGCLCHDCPVSSQESLESIFSQSHEDVIMIIFRPFEIENEEIWISLYEGIQLQSNNTYLFITSDLQKKIFYISKQLNAQTPADLIPMPSKATMISQIIKSLVTYIWAEDLIAQEELTNIRMIYCQQSLLFWLQSKRAFRVIHMSEVLDMEPYSQVTYDYPSDQDFIVHMLQAFENFYNKAKYFSKTSCGIYAQVNAARKIREILEIINYNSELIEKSKIQISRVGAQELLNQLKVIDDGCASRYFLSAFVCLTTSDLRLQVPFYYMQNVPLENFYSSFLLYQMGQYEEKELNNLQQAEQFYKEAWVSNPNCYQALFKKACFEAHNDKLDEAFADFQDVLKILWKGLDLHQIESWRFLSLKEIQYVFKTNIWLAKIAWNKKGEEFTGQYLLDAINAAIAYGKNECVSSLYEFIDISFQISDPVRRLWKLLQQWIRLTNRYNDDLKEKVDKEVESIEKIAKNFNRL